MLQRIISAKVFRSEVLENSSKKAIPITIPGMVFVTSAMLSITRFDLTGRELRVVISAAP